MNDQDILEHSDKLKNVQEAFMIKQYVINKIKNYDITNANDLNSCQLSYVNCMVCL